MKIDPEQLVLHTDGLMTVQVLTTFCGPLKFSIEFLCNIDFLSHQALFWFAAMVDGKRNDHHALFWRIIFLTKRLISHRF